MRDFGMTCQGCSFETDGGCSIGILEEIRDVSGICDLVDGHYQFDRICPHKTGSPMTEKESFEKCSLPISFIVLDDDLEKTQGLIKKIQELTKGKRAYSVCVVTLDHFKDLKELADTYHNYYVLRTFSENKDDSIRDAFLKVKNGYSIIIESEEDISQSHIDKLNMLVNKKMRRVGLISDSPVTINNALFKYLKGNKVVSYQQKLTEMSEEQKVSKMIYIWEEVNETVNL
tara:strand:+ start:4918 stop:5607 length:690 start_codon:yes stop_codon:yes gene_type:complete